MNLIASIIPWEWLAGAGALIAGLIVAWWRGWRSGAARAENRGLRAEVKAHEVRNEVDNRIAVERDARERLRANWQE